MGWQRIDRHRAASMKMRTDGTANEEEEERDRGVDLLRKRDRVEGVEREQGEGGEVEGGYAGMEERLKMGRIRGEGDSRSNGKRGECQKMQLRERECGEDRSCGAREPGVWFEVVVVDGSDGGGKRREEKKVASEPIGNKQQTAREVTTIQHQHQHQQQD
ncbi:hypothetical protein BDBG_05437 [Blastomyces gilchristii SLH14081]|uniref:Uncharacterized protein n=1 Tax=Blastomyces gilchristii (strain SLH14081) TaxID=559298 RepID=A0A179UPC7_BLAGS|nr:uncharacterized protein BDBG_05437 [Blastomyces gilchristii SLH14081]OAT09710.1 hypothetical protein BDBG_05437 [Blastomyces gilchristii SLH14081]